MRTLSEAWDVCKFRSFVAVGDHNLTERIGAAFAAVGGEPEPIQPERLSELVEVVRAGGSVVIMGSTRELRDFAKAELMLALSGVAGTA